MTTRPTPAAALLALADEMDEKARSFGATRNTWSARVREIATTLAAPEAGSEAKAVAWAHDTPYGRGYSFNEEFIGKFSAGGNFDPDEVYVRYDSLPTAAEVESTERASYREDDGCPTETAVLKREWRRMKQELATPAAAVSEVASFEKWADCEMPLWRNNPDGPHAQAARKAWNAACAATLSRPGEVTEAALPPLPPIESDEDFDRDYIPVPGGYEFQTKGAGSSYRIAKPSKGDDKGDRWIVCDPFFHKRMTDMARAIRDEYERVRQLALSTLTRRAPTDGDARDGERFRAFMEALLAEGHKRELSPAQQAIKSAFDGRKPADLPADLDDIRNAIDAAIAAAHSAHGGGEG